MSKHPETKRCEADSEFFIFRTSRSQSSSRLLRVVHLLAQYATLIGGRVVAALALTGRAAILSFEERPPRMRKFYDGGFEPEMTKREAALILGVSESAARTRFSRRTGR